MGKRDMTRATARRLTGAGLAIAVLTSAGLAGAANLTVIVQQVDGVKGGYIEVNLYTDKSTYREILMTGAGRGVSEAHDGSLAESFVYLAQCGV